MTATRSTYQRSATTSRPAVRTNHCPDSGYDVPVSPLSDLELARAPIISSTRAGEIKRANMLHQRGELHWRAARLIFKILQRIPEPAPRDREASNMAGRPRGLLLRERIGAQV